MNRQDLYRAMNEIDDDIIRRSEDAVFKPLSLRRLSIVLVAALLSLSLLGAGMMSGLFGDSIQSWFAYYWESITGRPMRGGHTALIDHLSQEIGLSETVEDITVTVDSATVGETSFFLLLRVEGQSFSTRYAYGFDQINVDLETGENSIGIAGYSLDFVGLDADGAVLLLLDYDYMTKDSTSEELPSMKVTLTMTDFAQNPRTSQRKVLEEGQWSFSFNLVRNELRVKHLPDTEVMADDQTPNDAYTQVPVILKNLQLTNTHISFQYDQRGGLHVPMFIEVILKDGKRISVSSGTGIVLENGELCQKCTWRIPVDLDEVVAIRINGTLIQVPKS